MHISIAQHGHHQLHKSSVAVCGSKWDHLEHCHYASVCECLFVCANAYIKQWVGVCGSSHRDECHKEEVNSYDLSGTHAIAFQYCVRVFVFFFTSFFFFSRAPSLGPVWSNHWPCQSLWSMVLMRQNVPAIAEVRNEATGHYRITKAVRLGMCITQMHTSSSSSMRKHVNLSRNGTTTARFCLLVYILPGNRVNSNGDLLCLWLCAWAFFDSSSKMKHKWLRWWLK